MNINHVLIRVLKKNCQILEQILHRNEKEEEVNHALEIKAREARDQEIAENFQDGEWESELEQLKQVEINRQTEDERWQSDELKKIEKETKDRKSELERLRVAARELDEANRLMKAEEEEIARLKRILGANEDNRRNDKIQARSRQEDEVYEEGEEEWGENFTVEASSEEEDEPPVRRSSKAKRNASGSPKKRLVAVVDSTDDEEDLQSLRRSRLRTARRKISSASLREEDFTSMKSAKARMVCRKTSLPEEDFTSMRSAKARMARRKISSSSLRIQETEDDFTDEDDDYAPLIPRKSPNANRKPQTSSGSRNADDLMTQFQGYTPMGSPYRSRSESTSHSGSSSPLAIYIPGLHIVNSIISNVGNDSSVKKAYRK